MSDLLARNVLVINQKAKLIELTDEYRIRDEEGAYLPYQYYNQANPEAHYSIEELSLASAYQELPADMRERLRKGERGKVPHSE